MKQIYICPMCFKVCPVDIPFDPTHITCASSSVTIKEISLNVLCDRCNTLMFKCDENMVGFVTRLNENGYNTLFCCEGHVNINEDSGKITSYSAPYIMFETAGHSDKVFSLCHGIINAGDFPHITVEYSTSHYDYPYPVRIGATLGVAFQDLEDHDFKALQEEFFKFLDAFINCLPIDFRFDKYGNLHEEDFAKLEQACHLLGNCVRNVSNKAYDGRDKNGVKYIPWSSVLVSSYNNEKVKDQLRNAMDLLSRFFKL